MILWIFLVLVILFVLVIFFLSFCFYISVIHNGRVYEHKMQLLDQVSRAAQKDIEEGKPWRWRYDALESVSYHKMVFMFWKPLDSFYKDRAFLS